MSDTQTLGIVCAVLYVVVGLGVAWWVLPTIYRAWASDFSEEWIARWMTLFAALLIGALWTPFMLTSLADRLIRHRIGDTND